MAEPLDVISDAGALVELAERHVRIGSGLAQDEAADVAQDAYDGFQGKYRDLVEDATRSGGQPPSNLDLTDQLDKLGLDHTYVNEAARLLRPTSVKLAITRDKRYEYGA